MREVFEPRLRAGSTGFRPILVGMCMPLVILQLVNGGLKGTTGQISDGDAVPSDWRMPQNDAINCLYLQIAANGDPMPFAAYRRLAAQAGVERNFDSLSKFAQSLGVNLVPVQLTTSELERLDRPCLLYMEPQGIASGQFWLFDRIDGDSVSGFSGPTLRLMRMSRDRFRREWTGYALVDAGPSGLAMFVPRLMTGALVILLAVLAWRELAGRDAADGN